MVGNQNWKIIFLVSGLILVLIYLLDNYISDTEEAIYKRLESSVISDMSALAKNIDILLEEKTIFRGNQSLFSYLNSSLNLRRDLERELNLFITQKIKYLYLVYKDDKQRFRYLLDGSSEDKARFNQKFDAEGPEYYNIYKMKKEFAITQKGLENLSITFVYPLIKNAEVEAILVFDFSSAFEYELRKIIAPLKTMFMLIYILIGVFLTVTAIQTLFYYQARKRSYIDQLTGCYNRQYLRYFLDTNDIANYQIMMIDFDHFKKVNDNYGHDIGDGVLIFCTKIIKYFLAKEDKIFRYGGEEFIVLIHNSSKAEDTAQEIRTQIEKQYFVRENVNINMTVSIGVNPIPAHARNTSQAINIADSMLYKAKIQGRNRVVVYDSDMKVNIEEIHSSSHNIHDVVEALNDDRVICCFHKIIDKNGTAYKYEALVRYITKEGKTVYPNHFLSDIRHTKVYTDLAKRVIDICVNAIETKKMAVSMNLNVNDLCNDVLLEYLIQKVQNIKYKDASLTVEMLESERIENMPEVEASIEKLHSSGIKVAIDDFGSGYANFNYLVELDVDYIKIDGYLVENALKSEKSKEIVKSIIDLAHQMQMKTITEFVSSKEVQELMESLGTDYLQGFYISKPSEDIS